MRQFQRSILSNVLHCVGDGVVITDRADDIVYINAAACAIGGCTSEAALYRQFSEVFPIFQLGGDASMLESPTAKAVRMEQTVGLEKNDGFRKENGFVYLSSTCSPLRDQGGRVQGAVAILRDITRLRDMEEAMLRERQIFKTVFADSPVGILILNDRGDIVQMNRMARSIMGAQEREVLSMQFGDAMCCLVAQENGCGRGSQCGECAIRRSIVGAIGSEVFSEIEVEMRHLLRGKTCACWLNIGFSPVYFAEEKGVVLIMRDVTDQKTAERQLREAMREAEAANRAKSLFLANMSHEIRTPVNGMLGMIDLAMLGPLGDEQRDNLEIAKSCAASLMNLIGDVLDVSKMEAGKLALESVPFDLPQMLYTTLRVHEKKAQEKGLEFWRDYAVELPQFFVGDPVRLKQIIDNLLTNAIKFTQTGSVRFRVASIQRAGAGGGEGLLFSVEDTGIGIAASDMSKLFQPFSQVDASITRRFGGTGLGLVIVKELVEQMGGQIRLESAIGRGTLVQFSLPEATAAPAAEEAPPVGVDDVEDLLRHCRDVLGN